MKKILLSLFVIGVVGVVAVGATRAYFSDTKSIGSNTMSTGTVKLGEVWNMPFAIEGLAPGVEKTTDIAVKYNGSLSADLFIGAQEHYGEDLGSVLEYAIEGVDSNWNHTGWIAGWTDFHGSEHLMNTWLKTHSNLSNGDWARARLHLRMKTPDSDNVSTDVDWNSYQNEKESIYIHLYAVQAGTDDVPDVAPRNLLD